MYSANASAHIYNKKIYIYPYYEIETDVKEAKNGGHYDMKNYHVFSMDSIKGKVTDYGNNQENEWSGLENIYAIITTWNESNYLILRVFI